MISQQYAQSVTGDVKSTIVYFFNSYIDIFLFFRLNSKLSLQQLFNTKKQRVKVYSRDLLHTTKAQKQWRVFDII